MGQKYDLSFRCFFEGNGNVTNHRQLMELRHIPKWLEAYMFTHPTVQAITVKVWPGDKNKEVGA